MLFQQATPETSFYLMLGLVAVAVLGIGYVISLVMRFRNLRKDIDIIESIKDEE